MRKICYIFFCISYSFYAQKKVQLVNKINQPIPYAFVKYGGEGTYSNEEGYFLCDVVKNDSISIKAFGYKTLKKATIDVKDIITLEDDIIELNEVIIEKKKSARKEQVKAINSNDFLDGFAMKSGGEIAVLIENNYSGKIILKKLIIPIYTKSIYTVLNKPQVLKKIPFTTFLKVKFYSNNNLKPGDKINEDEIVISIDEKADNFFEIDLKENNILLPEGGFFVSFESLGKKSESGELFLLNSVKKSSLLMPLLIVTNKVSTAVTFIRNNFDKKINWKNISDSDISITPNSKKMQIENIGIGYDLDIYE